MATVKLEYGNLKVLRTVDKRLVSYNVEMTEVTGGTFWKAYTPGQIAGTESFPPINSMEDYLTLMQWYDPIDSKNPRLIRLAKELGSAWIRVSGSWATGTYYDFDDTGTPEGYRSTLTKEQWESLIHFVDAVDGKLLISVSNCEGLHHTDEPWNPSEAEKIFRLSCELGHPIDAVEFTNEPNMMEGTGFPKGYRPEHFRRDQDLFHRWLRENYPETLVVGPCTTDSNAIKMGPNDEKGGAGIGDFLAACPTDELMEGCTEKLDVFSYHYYNGISERLESMMPNAHWKADQAHTEDYLAVAGRAARAYAPFRDKYVPGGQMWVTESGDAGGGGDTWASTYLDVLRTLNELGEFCTVTDGVIFHNTLASSDYGFLDHHDYAPRPNYFAVLLWTRLMGNTVYDSGIPSQEGAHVYCHSRKDGQEGCVYLVINNALTEATTVELPTAAVRYTLDGNGDMRSSVMYLNGRPLTLGDDDRLPDLSGEIQHAGTVTLSPGSCTFFVI